MVYYNPCNQFSEIKKIKIRQKLRKKSNFPQIRQSVEGRRRHPKKKKKNCGMSTNHVTTFACY